MFRSLGSLFMMVSHSEILVYFASRRLPDCLTIVARREGENESKCWEIEEKQRSSSSSFSCSPSSKSSSMYSRSCGIYRTQRVMPAIQGKRWWDPERRARARGNSIAVCENLVSDPVYLCANGRAPQKACILTIALSGLSHSVK